MLDRLKSKLKRLLSGAPKDTSTDRVDVAPSRIDRVKVSIDTKDFAQEFLGIQKIVAVTRLYFDYKIRHAGMTSYQKWHKQNKKWR